MLLVLSLHPMTVKQLAKALGRTIVSVQKSIKIARSKNLVRVVEWLRPPDGAAGKFVPIYAPQPRYAKPDAEKPPCMSVALRSRRYDVRQRLKAVALWAPLLHRPRRMAEHHVIFDVT